MSVEADFVVVGAGSAGCLLANRLSANPANRVVLLEAGGRGWNPLIRVPLMAGLLYFMPSLNWGYQTEPQRDLDQRSIVWPRGRVLGGSTAINGMMYVRGHASDYRHWRQLGLEGWDYDDVLPAFKAFERNLSHADGDQWHGREGELITQKAKGGNPLYKAWLEAAKSAGYPANDDFNGATQEGVGFFDFNIHKGRRVSAATAFLDPIRRRPNLQIITRGRVERLRFDGRRCIGLSLNRGGETVEVTALKEVILCAGAINTPQILMLSGVGPAEALRSLGIDLVLDRPSVGQNLHDHLGVRLQHRALQPVTLYGLMRPDRAILAGLQALLLGSGPAASVPLEAGAFLKTRPDLEEPDVHVICVPGLSLAATQSGQMEHGFVTSVYQLRPQSRGAVTLRSADSRVKPSIDPNYLHAEADRLCLREGLRLARKIVAQPPLDAHRGEERSPGVKITTNAEIDHWVSQTASTIFHPVGTCRMGVDASAVLDARLKVRGIEGLRVADASAMPEMIGGNTSAPTMMIAERAATFILADDERRQRRSP